MNRSRMLAGTHWETRRLWDETGREWQPFRDQVLRAEVLQLLARDDVKVGIYTGRRLLQWVRPEDTWRVWREDIDDNFHDRPDYKPPRSAPGQLPYHGTLYQSGDDLLLLFDDFD
jgi:hypothetical protein